MRKIGISDLPTKPTFMSNEQAPVVFEKYNISRFYDEASESWYFSEIDVVGALTDSANPRDYWFRMKARVKGEDGFELWTICRQFVDGWNTVKYERFYCSI